MIAETILQKCIQILGVEVLATSPMSGGDINQAMVLETKLGRFFLKTNTSELAGEMFESEAQGLNLLNIGAITTAEVLGFGNTDEGGFLLLKYIETGYRPAGFWEEFGEKMAELHRHSAPVFGLGYNNFIGTLPQSNCQHGVFSDFYIQERLLPQLSLAQQQNLLQTTDYQGFDLLFKRLPSLIPKESPSMIHGDFWSGNFLCNSAGHPVLIDPAVCYVHREMDLAMSRLFRGFDRPFYNAYEAAWPLESGFEQRLTIYQLYYLLVHVNLFGGGYVGQVRSILNQFK